jgi:hypothetical protein
MVRMLNTKSPHWNYEDEYRLTKHGASNKAFTLPSEAIVSVVLGCNMNFDDRKAIIQVVDDGLSKCQIYEARTNLESFKLDINGTVKIKV